MKKLPKRAIISITQRCNSRCSFCNIWQITSPAELDARLIDRLPVTLREADITGGEPLLHKDFRAIVERFLKRDCRIIVTTNGLVDMDRYEDLWKNKGIGVRFSLDGIADIHDGLRGIEGNYAKVLERIRYLKGIGSKDIGISSTFSDANIGQIKPLYELSRKMGVGFTFMAAANSGIYYMKNDNVIDDRCGFSREIRKIVRQELGRFNVSRWGSSVVYLSELAEFLEGRIRSLCCPAGDSFFFMQPTGEIFACNMRDDLYMGNLNDAVFEDIWQSKKACMTRKQANPCASPCWTMCNAKSIILRHKARYFFRSCVNILKNLRGPIRCPR